MSERERNREILQELHPDLLKWMDEMREEFEGAKVVKLVCEIKKQWGKK